jgi:hypothetical protein
MKLNLAGLAVIAVLALLGSSRAINADRRDSLTPGPTHGVAIESGVVSAGSSLIVRMDDTINTDRAYRTPSIPELSLMTSWTKTGQF